jgi:hypothetical protein
MELNVCESNVGDYLRSQSLETDETSSVEDFNYVYAKDDKDLICVNQEGIEKISCSSIPPNDDNSDGEYQISAERLDVLNCDNNNLGSQPIENRNGGTIEISVTSENEENQDILIKKSQNTNCDSARLVDIT